MIMMMATKMKHARENMSFFSSKRKDDLAHHGVLHIRVYPRLLRIDADLDRKVDTPAEREGRCCQRFGV